MRTDIHVNMLLNLLHTYDGNDLANDRTDIKRVLWTCHLNAWPVTSTKRTY